MPHLQFREFIQPKMPIAPEDGEDIAFEFIASNANSVDEQLIGVKSNEQRFLLQLRKRESSYLLKCEKYTRPSINVVVQQALKAYAKASSAKVSFSNLSTKEHHHMQNKDSIVKPIEFFVENFPTDKEVWIEVGFGSGRHLLHQASQNPDVLVIGIEIHKPSIEQVVKQVNIQNLENVLLLDYDARLFLEFVPSNIVGKIFVHFPVPWDKKPHRRVISSAFISESIRALSKNGKLNLRTDSENYFSYSLQTFLDLNQVDFHLRKNAEIEIKSKYEDRWVKMQKNIYDITMINSEHSDELMHIEKFEFEKKIVSQDHLKDLNNKTFKFDDSFIHIQNLYNIDEESMLLSLTMGNFERPSHVFITIDASGIEYYSNSPIRSRTNLFLHQKLKGLLYE